VRQVKSKVPFVKSFIIGNECRPSGINPIAIRRTVAIWFKAKRIRGKKSRGDSRVNSDATIKETGFDLVINPR
jgi:hypothetical protein